MTLRAARAAAFIVCCLVVAFAVGVPAARAQRRTSVTAPSRATAEQKIQAPLMTEIYRRRGDAAARRVPRSAEGVVVDRHGRATVDVRAQVTAPLTRKIVALGGRVVSTA